MLCKKQPAIIIISNKQTNLILTKWLRLRPFLKKSTPAPLLFSKFVKTPAGVHSDTPAPVHLWYKSNKQPIMFFSKNNIQIQSGSGCSRENLTPDPVRWSWSPAPKTPKSSPCTPLVLVFDCAAVRRTPNQTDSDVTFSRSCYHGKITKEDWKITTDVNFLNWFSELNFKTVLFQLAWFSWFSDASLLFRFVFS